MSAQTSATRPFFCQFTTKIIYVASFSKKPARGCVKKRKSPLLCQWLSPEVRLPKASLKTNKY